MDDYEDLERLSQITESQLIDALIPKSEPIAYIIDENGHTKWIDCPVNGMYLRQVPSILLPEDRVGYRKRICLGICHRNQGYHGPDCPLTKSFNRATLYYRINK